MNTSEKQAFIASVFQDLERLILDRVCQMPASWDGLELRQYIADVTKEKVVFKMTTKRLKDYKNEVIIRNL